MAEPVDAGADDDEPDTLARSHGGASLRSLVPPPSIVEPQETVFPEAEVRGRPDGVAYDRAAAGLRGGERLRRGVTDWLGEREIDALLARFEPLFAHHWATGVAPDEVNFTPGATPPDRTRQLCNVWRSDRVVARTVLAERNARFAAALEGAGGMVLIQDNMLWKPPGGRALLAHQDNAYNSWLDPVNMTTCWMALDRRHHGGHRHDLLRAWLAPLAAGAARRLLPRSRGLARSRADGDPSRQKADLDRDLVPIEVPAGGAAFHHGWTFHGSPPNRRVDAQRRSVVSHLARIGTGHHPTNRHPIYSRYLRPGSLALDEAHFPVVWSADGYRRPWLDA